MRNPLQGLRTRQSPVQSSRLPPATHFLHTRGQRPWGGQGLATVAELGLRGPFFQLEVEQKERGAGGRQPGSPRLVWPPRSVKSTLARGPEATSAPRPHLRSPSPLCGTALSSPPALEGGCCTSPRPRSWLPAPCPQPRSHTA